jgi:hypothetical protein
MSCPGVLFSLAIGLLLAVDPMLAATYAVGPCKPTLVSFPTISAAVSGVPPGSTVLVCPGTYSEQVTIAQPLTLKGITSGNAGEAVITVPGSGLTVVTTGFGDQIAAMVDVTAGPVNISDITVDGTGNNVGGYPTWLAGILYNDGSSGTVNEVTVRNLSDSGYGVGTWAENSTGTIESVTIENSSFHDIDDSGVVTLGSNLVATVKGNTVEFGAYQIQYFSSGGSLTANVLNGGYVGMFAFAPVTISGNTVNNQSHGIEACCGVTATSNKISNASTGIYDGGGDTYKSNTITKAGVGIDFNCQTPAVLSNTINDATTGLNNVPSSFSGVNSFNNVVTLRTDGCGFRPTPPAAPPSGPLRAPAH